ncbi:hypothetical protein ACFXDJ_19350 [Streptomyces sp. NPDC059443]|uniref:LppU/SCO3897 family protein n=1 Tax=unclassified Streptomyces TaxID=2593676 RepID=UPI0036BD824F
MTITPKQATYGAIVPVTLPSGPVRLRIPPCKDGDLVRVRVGGSEVLARIRVDPAAGAAASGPVLGHPGGGPGAAARGCLVGLGVLVALVVGVAVLSSTNREHGPEAAPTAVGTTPAGGAVPVPAPAPSQADPTPFNRGTCLNGSLPDSTTAQKVTGVEEVSCSASDAHYRVIESIPLTSDLNRCNGNPKTEYAFSYRYTLNGAPINQYVYCLVGIGSYARH